MYVKIVFPLQCCLGQNYIITHLCINLGAAIYRELCAVAVLLHVLTLLRHHSLIRPQVIVYLQTLNKIISQIFMFEILKEMTLELLSDCCPPSSLLCI